MCVCVDSALCVEGHDLFIGVHRDERRRPGLRIDAVIVVPQPQRLEHCCIV